MYINSIGHYIPQKRVSNEYFKQINGLDSDWIVQRTGIATRSQIADDEDVTTMALDAVEDAEKKLQYPISDIDLIISGGYAITDTVGTVAHRVQKWFNIQNAKVLAITSACSSFVNAVEIAECYFAARKAKKALIVCSETNSIYNDYSNPQSGHLWGDAAVAVFLSAEKINNNNPKITDVLTKGLAHIGKGPDGVFLHPNNGGLVMHDGRDVYLNACTYMASTMEELLERNYMTIADITYFACHQANLRIISNVAQQWKLPQERFFNNITELGNTGSASAMLSISQNINKINPGDTIGLAVFGGGYSSGAMIIRF